MLRSAEGPATTRVLMLHGLAGSTATWTEFAQLADQGCELWAADLPWRGEGYGGWAQGHDATGWVLQALAAVPGHVDVLVAHSFSATVSLAVLADAGLRGAVLVAPFYRARPEEFDWSTLSYYLNNFHEILREGIRVRADGRVAADVQHDMALRVRERVGPYGWIRFFDAYLRTPRLSLTDVGIPCLVVGGERDPASFPADCNGLVAALPHAEVHLLAGSGHFPMIEQPEEFAGIVNGFLAAISAPALEHTE